MPDIYIDSTFKNEWNVSFNPLLCAALEEKGVICHLPQRDTDQSKEHISRFNTNVEVIKNIKTLVAVAANESPNWGVEVGYAYGVGTRIVAICEKGHEIPLMARFMVAQIIEVESLDDIPTYIEELVAAIG